MVVYIARFIARFIARHMVGYMVGIVISFLIIRPTKNGREVIILHKFGLMQTIAFILHKNYDFSIFIPLHAL